MERLLYQYGYDTRCRNLDAARHLEPLIAAAAGSVSPVLLDVGCGKFGLAPFLPNVSIQGVDAEPAMETPPNMSFQSGDITALPFSDRSFPIVACIDVLEHLSLASREQAISELLRVADMALLLAFPHGSAATECDRRFQDRCTSRGRSVPDWVVEHLKQPYPEVSTVTEQIKDLASAWGRVVVDVSSSYCEPLWATRFLRACSARSGLLYLTANLPLGSFSQGCRSPMSIPVIVRSH